MVNWTNARLCDVANLILGAILFFSPWIFGFDGSRAAENANIAGIVIVVLAVAAIAAFAVWEEWLNLIVGLWTLVSPWVLNFHATPEPWRYASSSAPRWPSSRQLKSGSRPRLRRG